MPQPCAFCKGGRAVAIPFRITIDKEQARFFFSFHGTNEGWRLTADFALVRYI